MAPKKTASLPAKRRAKHREPTTSSVHEGIELAEKRVTTTGFMWGPGEVREHLLFIEKHFLNGFSEKQIAQEASVRYGLKFSRVRRLLGRIQEDWNKQDQEQRRYWRAKTIRQLEKIVALAQNGTKVEKVRGKKKVLAWDIRPNPSAAVRGLELLSKVQGTQAPIEFNLNVQVSDALTAVISNLSSEQVQAALQSYREDRALAEQARRAGIVLQPVESAAE